MNEQPEALRLAELLSTHYNIYGDTVEAAAELRRLHAEVERLRANLQPSVPDGWKLVPVEPTEDMQAGYMKAGSAPWSERYRDMLAAAPQPPGVDRPETVSASAYDYMQALCDIQAARIMELEPQREPLSDDVIQELADDGVFQCNVFEIVRRIEEEHGIYKLRSSSIK